MVWLYNFRTIIAFSYNRELSGFTTLQLLIHWDRNDYYRRFNLPIVVSIFDSLSFKF
jgi:hypothetical protein